MTDSAPAERLQPALLDRLVDDAPEERAVEPATARVLNRARLRASVLRDLAWLLNSTGLRPLADAPHVTRSVVNYGLPPLAGVTASTLDVVDLERAVRAAILAFEPRILPGTLEVRAVAGEDELDRHNLVSLRIAGMLWAQPVPLEILLRTSLDLETGQVEVQDLGSRPG